MKPAVLSSVVDCDLCIGCGVCASICPDQILEIQFNKFGEYTPVSKGDCTKECGLCLKVCPFADGNPDEDDIGKELFFNIAHIQHRSETGYFLATYAGYSNIGENREHGSSGGMATWLLETLLKDGIVDAVACVTHNPDTEKLFKFSIFSSVEEIRSASGSAYYPVELSNVIRFILDNPGKYAIIGLPCFVKSIRLAQQRNKKLRERIVVILGLTCGQLKNKYFTSYIGALSGLNAAPTRVFFRGKDYKQTANNYYFSFKDNSGKEFRIHRNDGISEAWGNRWFTQNACNYCDDIFAECADVSFMDAWLPEYASDPLGTNLIIVRSQRALEIFQGAIMNHAINVDEISIGDVVQSQEGVIAVKRDHLSYHLYLLNKNGITPLKKRVDMGKKMNPFILKIIRLKEKMRITTRCYPAAVNGNEVFNSEMLRKSMNHYINQIHLLQKFSSGVTFPIRIIYRFKEYLNE
ncbi:MAG: 4Fe-4S ferredoxin [Methanomicrobiales archaeon HGW-Methanomicrobiales-1]|jgi:coenzyme F420-reducing hydrogenase beta subunit|nr:MAG: 4Fe-4S ferredoxin [Methanomicrobiales archaeon HGW-Methanomicrobiales-1]